MAGIQKNAPVFNLSVMDAFPFYEALHGVPGSPIRGGMLDPRHRALEGRPALSLLQAARDHQNVVANARGTAEGVRVMGMNNALHDMRQAAEQPAPAEEAPKPDIGARGQNIMRGLGIADTLFEKLFGGN